MFSFLGNLLWFLLIGFWSGLGWMLAGLLWCITIVGIPVGRQCFKLAKLTFFPFGKRVVYGDSTFSFLVNVIWLLVNGWELAVFYFVWGVILCITVVGIPAGRQCFKLAKLALMPFGARVESE